MGGDKPLFTPHDHGGHRGDIPNGVLVNMSLSASDGGGEFGFGVLEGNILHPQTAEDKRQQNLILNEHKNNIKFAPGTVVTFPPNWVHWVTPVTQGIREQFVMTVTGVPKTE